MAANLLYSPLDRDKKQIRLLHVHPRNPTNSEDIVECDLLLASLKEEDLEYDALSYCWGSPEPRRRIRINQKDVEIGPCLASALRNLRYPDRDLILWVDALCINQDDNEERSAQVQQMSLVYSRASMVQVWLGPTPDGGSFPTKMIDRWIDRSRSYYVSLKLELPQLDGLFALLPAVDDKSAQLAVFNLGTRPYWSRLWIVQELALVRNATIHYGHQKLSLEYLLIAEPVITLVCQISTIFEDQSHLAGKASSARDMTLTLRSLEATRSRLYDEAPLTTKIVASLASRETSDARDKIYALISMSENEDLSHVAITADYNKTVEEVYIDFARAAVENRQTYDLFQIAGAGGSGHDQANGLPTWAPDWRTYDVRGVYRHSHPSRVDGRCGRGTSICVIGRKVAEVQRQLTAPFLSTEQFDLPQRREEFQDFLQDFVMLDTDLGHGEPRLQQLLRLLDPRPLEPGSEEHKIMLAGLLQTIVKFMSSLDLSDDEEEIHTKTIGLRLLSEPATEKDVDDLTVLGQETYSTFLSHTFDYIISERINDSRVFLPDGGDLGFGLPNVRASDGIFNLWPEDATFVLRANGKETESESWFTNFGECYITDLSALDGTVLGHSEVAEAGHEGGSRAAELEYVDIEIR